MFNYAIVNIYDKKRHQKGAFFRSVWLQGLSYPVEVRPLGAVLQSNRRLRLFVLLGLGPSPDLLSSYLYNANRSQVWPIRSTHHTAYCR